ncbi:MAG: hypothetical protein JNL13_14615 [Chitinophagaceae bacterium]|nr:hypothetical protein [Chitinophagaceae bacterium]
MGIKCLALGLASLTAMGIASCTKEKKSSGNIPKIQFTGLSGNTIKAGSNQVIYINFNFSDGNGDLGNKPSSGNYDIYTKDSRDDSSEVNYFFPQDLPGNVEPGQEMSGVCNLGLLGAFVLLRPSHPDRDTVRYEIYIKDRAGNESNRFTTPDIYIIP